MPGASVYNIPAALRVRGPLDVPLLERCVIEVVRRHEILRTTFLADGAQPRQIIGSARPFTIPVLDLESIPAGDRDAEMQRILLADSVRPFSLTSTPLWRVTAIRLARADYVLGVTTHHIIGDGWSIGVWVREVVTLYTSFYKGQPSPLDDLPIQYADYAAWQRESLRGETLDRELQYWRDRLRDAPPLELPTDRSRPALQSYRGAGVPIVIRGETCEGLKRLAQEQRATLFMTLLAGFVVLLSRYSGQADISVGTPIAGRTRPEIEGLIGFFVNTLVMRVGSVAALPTSSSCSAVSAGRPSERSRIRICRSRSWSRSCSRIASRRARNPLFQVMFALAERTIGGARRRDALRHPARVARYRSDRPRSSIWRCIWRSGDGRDGYAGVCDGSVRPEDDGTAGAALRAAVRGGGRGSAEGRSGGCGC